MFRLYLALVFLSSWWVMSLASDEPQKDPAPLEVNVVKVDTVGLGVATTVSISVRCWPKLITNVTARIVPNSGFEIINQPKMIVANPRDTGDMVFEGTIRATVNGIWPVKVEGVGTWSGTKEFAIANIFYIQISDSLCRWLTPSQYYVLTKGKGRSVDQRISKGDSVLITPHRHRTAEPALKDSLIRRDSVQKKLSGTFDLVGTYCYQDPRDERGRRCVNSFSWRAAAAKLTIVGISCLTDSIIKC